MDAAISTPSTAMLEAMLLGLPVAALDYTNSPAFVQPAWSITARAQMPVVVAELMRPSAAKMLFQGNDAARRLGMRHARRAAFGAIGMAND